MTQKGQKEARKTEQKSVVNIPDTGYNERQEETVTEESIKDFKELDLSDNFMFSAVMKDPELCIPLLEMILDVRIERIKYTEKEKTIATKPDTRACGWTYMYKMARALSMTSRYRQQILGTCH